MKPLLLALLVLLPIIASPFAGASPDTPEDAQPPMVYRYWDWSLTKNRDDYQVAALHLALGLTQKEYGPYEITRLDDPLSNARLMREINAAAMVNVHAAPAFSRAHRFRDYVNEIAIMIELPVLQGLLGYRQLIVPHKALPHFERISDTELRDLVAGQGREWTDVGIYRHNGYKVNEEGENTQLLQMLLAGRFDYLPMSIIEVDDVIARAENPALLAKVESLMIFYPQPVYFYVSRKTPEHAQRLELGLKKAIANGSLEKLVREHFGKEIAQLNQPTNRWLYLENPSVPTTDPAAQPKLLTQKP